MFKDFYVILGTPISFLTDARQSWTIETDGEYYHLDLGPDNLYPELNKFEVGLKYGLSLHFVGRIYTDFIFYKSFTKLYKSGYKMYEDDLRAKSEFKNNSFTVRFHYRF
ncbi:hypothetical protein ACX8XP_06010 [Calditrichota bacterium LG25]